MLLALQVLDFPYLIEGRDGPPLHQMAGLVLFLRIGWLASTVIATVFAVVALVRREDGRLRAGLVLGAVAMTLLFVLGPYLARALRSGV